MNDLISKSEVLELLYKIFDKYYMSTDKNPSIISKSFGTESFGIDVFKEIKKMPTAYSVDNVVEELELHSFELGTDTLPVHYVRLNEAIEILVCIVMIMTVAIFFFVHLLNHLQSLSSFRSTDTS